MLPDIHRATQKFYIFLIVYLTGCTPPDSKIVSLFFQIQRLDKNKKKFALSMVESMLDNLAGL